MVWQRAAVLCKGTAHTDFSLGRGGIQKADIRQVQQLSSTPVTKDRVPYYCKRINLSIYQFINLSIYQFINLYLTIYQFINLSIYQFINSEGLLDYEVSKPMAYLAPAVAPATFFLYFLYLLEPSTEGSF